ncbi:PTS ascorbate transporter subunit IIC [Clostridium perfringens]|uniref:Ascorbate-specific PTS system EIIC component n=1 Tax=Clostridium perfringens (strain SM101 / Type A) TaxID=289380 RepID=Q0SVN1_CLOPS|nr:PTS ascorbate transporter subunit IIC [Clostridium perfringens]ABG87029.1 PTS system, L-Ascorbate family, IIC component [Clostridium perfringens SM101]EJT5917371.1 PTS ascorbate transporter subunit IIC [Clostridium perfringens]EJT5926002.1 PTS ascorbate transporter subunit IIC [Clostridium perfringens]EJT5940519.1 PTS ascorbate transporter subunit IIC [Clostridium perfringens]EJT6136086.1 PTS ascorbate transporter subunit IIC [Clostridium perfringens]
MKEILDFCVSFFRNPALFMGLVVAIGLILQRKPIDAILKGIFKGIIGMVILLKGVDIVVSSITPLANAFSGLFNTQSNSTLGDFNVFLGQYGSYVGLILLCGFVINIIIARYTRFKTIYLTGNILFWYPMLFLAVGIENNVSGLKLFIFTLIMYILVITIFPYILRKHVKYVTGNDSFTIGHTASIYCLLGSYIGKLVGQKDKNIENLNLPKSLSFFRDTNITAAIVMFIVYIIVGLFIGKESRTAIYGSEPLITYSLIQGITFAAGMIILLTGVRMILGEIIPSFKGIADKLAKGSIPALDIPMIFPYGPNALLIGFIIALITSIGTLFLLGASGVLTFALIPLVVACYFDVAPGAIFANARGGWPAAIITSALGGIILMVLAFISLNLVSGTVGNFIQTYGGNEFSIWVIIGDLVGKLFSI